MTDEQTRHDAAYLSALRRNYTFDPTRAALAEAVAQLADARATLKLAQRLTDRLGVVDHTVLAHSAATLAADLRTLQQAVADTADALLKLQGHPLPVRTSEYTAADGIRVVQIDTPTDAGPIRVNLNDTRIHDDAAATRDGDYWPTEAGLVALDATDHPRRRP